MIVGKLSLGRVVQDTAILRPEPGARLEGLYRTARYEITLAHGVLPRIQKAQWAGELGCGVGHSPVLYLVGEILVVLTIVESTGGKARTMAFYQMDLFDLTAIRNANVFDTEEVLGIVGIRSNLTPVLLDFVDVG